MVAVKIILAWFVVGSITGLNVEPDPLRIADASCPVPLVTVKLSWFALSQSIIAQGAEREDKNLFNLVLL